jgi:flagellar biosynthetic protein FliQ
VSDTAIIEVATQAMLVTAKLCAPILLTALVVGFAVSLFQSATQIQEQTLSFVPKLITVGIALIVTGSWMLHTVVSFTNELFAKLPSLLGQG